MGSGATAFQMISGLIFTFIGGVGYFIGHPILIIIADTLNANDPVNPGHGSPSSVVLAQYLIANSDIAFALLVLFGLVLFFVAAFKKEPNEYGY